MTALTDTQKKVLLAIKARGPVSAKQLSSELGLDEKHGIRNAIDALRSKGESIWSDPSLNAFWWRDDVNPTTEPHRRWKRIFIPSF